MKKLIIAIFISLMVPSLAWAWGLSSGSGIGISNVGPFGGINGGGPTSNGLELCQNAGNYSWCKKPFWKITGVNDWYSNGSSGATATDRASSSRILQTSNGPISRMALVVFNGSGTTAGTFEQNGKGSLIQRASLEYPSANTPLQFSVAGNTTWVLDAASPWTITDPIGVSIPSATNYYIRYYNRTAAPPTSVSVGTSAQTGALATSTTYYYKVTTVDTGIESGPAAEASVSTGSGTSLALTWTASAFANSYNIYRDTTTNTETLVANVPAPSTGWIDTGLGQITSATTVPAQVSYWFSQQTASANYQTNVQQSGGNGLDYTTSTGGTWLATPGNNQLAMQYAILSDDMASNPVCLLGDSTMAGTGIITNAAQGHGGATENWGAVGVGISRPFLNQGIGGAKQLDLVNGVSTIVIRRRVGLPMYCDLIVNNSGRNDLYTGSQTWQAVASNHIQLGRGYTQEGKHYYVTTLMPNTSSTDSFITASNQTVISGANEAKRTNFNNWIRNGLLVDGSGTPVLSGGTATPYITGYFDQASTVEVNSSNVLTNNGSFWRAPSAAAYTGQVLTGSPSATSLPVGAAAYPVNGLTTYAVKITSGSQSGNFCMVASNTATAITCEANGGANFTGIGTYVGLSGSPSANDTFDIYAIYTPQDGVHGTTTAYAAIGAAFSTWLAALAPF